MSEHKIPGKGPIHAWDCPPCVEEADKRKARMEARVNPHRPGTKVWQKFERERFQGSNAVDPRTETYWSM